MTNLEKQFLDCCVEYYSDCSSINSDDLLEHLNVPLLSLQRCAERLEQQGYIKKLLIRHNVRFTFQLTYEGAVRKEMHQERIKKFLLESLFVPIAVSIISSLIVSSAGYLLGIKNIKEKIQNPIAQPTSELNTDSSGRNQQ